MRYWVRERSDWRIEIVRLMFWVVEVAAFEVCKAAGIEGSVEEVRSSILVIWNVEKEDFCS